MPLEGDNKLYELKIETGFVLPTGEVDGIILLFETIEEANKISEIAIKQGYTIQIRYTEE